MVILRENNDEFLERGGGGDFSTSRKSATLFSETRAGGSKGVFSENSSKSDNPNIPNWTIGHESESRV